MSPIERVPVSAAGYPDRLETSKTPFQNYAVNSNIGVSYNRAPRPFDVDNISNHQLSSSKVRINNQFGEQEFSEQLDGKRLAFDFDEAS